MKTLKALTLGTMFLALPLAAQMQPPGAAYGPSISARQATPGEAGYQGVTSTVVPNPMLLDISLGAYSGHLSLLARHEPEVSLDLRRDGGLRL